MARLAPGIKAGLVAIAFILVALVAVVAVSRAGQSDGASATVEESGNPGPSPEAAGQAETSPSSAVSPGAPTITEAIPGNQQVRVSFNAPESDGGAAVRNYRYSIDGGNNWMWRTPGSAISPWTITGLENGTTYKLALQAVNAVGPGAVSSVVDVTPQPVSPGPPKIASVIPGNQQLRVAFKAPESDGGAAVRNYRYSLDGGTTWRWRTPGSTASPWTISGLENGTTYQLALQAVNSVGQGAVSPVVEVTPRPTSPGPAQITAVTPGIGQIEVSFNAPESDGGTPVTNYRYSLDGGVTWRMRTPASVASPWVITGLTDATIYRVALQSVNAAGPGAVSNVVEATPGQ